MLLIVIVCCCCLVVVSHVRIRIVLVLLVVSVDAVTGVKSLINLLHVVLVDDGGKHLLRLHHYAIVLPQRWILINKLFLQWSLQKVLLVLVVLLILRRLLFNDAEFVLVYR